MWVHQRDRSGVQGVKREILAMCALCRREGGYFVPKMKVKNAKSGSDGKKQEPAVLCQPCGQLPVGVQSMSNTVNGNKNKQTANIDDDNEEEEEDAEIEYICENEDGGAGDGFSDTQIMQLRWWAVGICALVAMVLRKKMR